MRLAFSGRRVFVPTSSFPVGLVSRCPPVLVLPPTLFQPPTPTATIPIYYLSRILGPASLKTP